MSMECTSRNIMLQRALQIPTHNRVRRALQLPTHYRVQRALQLPTHHQVQRSLQLPTHHRVERALQRPTHHQVKRVRCPHLRLLLERLLLMITVSPLPPPMPPLTPYMGTSNNKVKLYYVHLDSIQL